MIGNPLAANVSGVNAEISYSSNSFDAYDDGSDPTIQSRLKSKKIRITEKLLRAQFIKTDVIISDASPSELAYIKIQDVKHEGLELLTSR